MIFEQRLITFLHQLRDKADVVGALPLDQPFMVGDLAEGKRAVVERGLLDGFLVQQ